MTTARRFLFPIICLMFLFLTLQEYRPLFETAVWQWRRTSVCGVKGDGPFVDAPRILYRRHTGGETPILQWMDETGRFTSIDRTIHQALTWEMLPDAPLTGRETESADTIIVASVHADPSVSATLSSRGFRLQEELHGTQIWQRQGTTDIPRQVAHYSQGAVSIFREAITFTAIALLLSAAWLTGGLVLTGIILTAMGVLPLLPILIGAKHSMASVSAWTFVLVATVYLTTVWRRHRRTVVPRNAIIYSTLFFCLCAFIALSYGLPANNGLGVYAGKAKLWWFAEGFPPNYFTASKYATMQTSYPLGFPLIIWFLNALTGGIAEHFAQLLPPLFLSFCIGSLVSVINQSKRSFLFFSLLLASSGILIATRLYSEPLMTLFLLAGIDAIIQKKQSGFLLLGMCGWVKTEGLLIAFAAWGALVIMFFPLVHDKQTGWCRNISTLLLTVAPGLCWFGVSRCCGGTPHDYAPLWTPNLFRGIQASKEVLTNIFLTPWHPACYFLPVCLPIVSFVMKNKEDKKKRELPSYFSRSLPPVVLSISSRSVSQRIFPGTANASNDCYLYPHLPRGDFILSRIN